MDITVSEELNGIIGYAREEAMRTGCYGIGPDHLFLGIIRHSENVAANTLRGIDVDTDQLKKFIDSRVFTNEHIPYEELEHITFSRGAQNVLSLTIMEATRSGSREASSQHLLLALCRTTGSYGQAFLRSVGVDYSRILSYLQKNGLLGGQPKKQQPEQNDDGDDIEYSTDENRQQPEKKKGEGLEEFGYDLTKAAREGKLDPVVGRDVEISRVIEILGRRKKNNPMLIGEPGVGKSAIVEGIALQIAKGDIPPSLAKKKIISLDIASVVAGTKYRGDFEKRVKNIIATASNDPDVILFIDEFHTIVGAGGAGGSLDAANMLKPALARGELQCIGATTMDEFTKIVEKDGALDRRFQKIIVEATDVPQSITILKNLRHNYEEFHKISYTDEALEACVRLTDRYMTDRSLPDKAIDAMDEAGSMVRLKGGSTVGEEEIATVVSKMTGIPVNKVAESEAGRILKMKDRLRGRIIGQDDAINTIVGAIQRNRAGLKDPKRPIGSFLFFGPTGVGKTQLAKCLAEYLFDSEENIVRIDMSEYMEKFSVSRLIGAPPGYVGYEEGGQLTEAVRRKPYSIVLLDEIEKAHPEVFNLLLQILDDGRVTDSKGVTVDFKNTIIIMTSNLGSQFAFEPDYEKKEKEYNDLVRATFKPEFVNRIDDLIIFNPLNNSVMSQIVDKFLRQLSDRLKDRRIALEVSDEAKQKIINEGSDVTYGARPLKRYIQQNIETLLAYKLIEEEIPEESTLLIDVKNNDYVISLKKNVLN